MTINPSIAPPLLTSSAFLATMLNAGTVAAAPPAETHYFFHNVALHEGAAADIHAAVLVNPKRPRGAATVVAVHGFAHTGETFRPLAEAMFASACPGRAISRFVIIDLPGHGESSPPWGVDFGDLTLSDYTSAVLGTLSRLEDEDMRTDVLVGHSMGGLVVGLAQQRLLSEGYSLRTHFGTRQAILIAPVVPRGIAWSFADSGAAATLMGSWITSDPELGTYLHIPTDVWPSLFFADSGGITVDAAPSPATVVQLGYGAHEPLVAGAELVGAAGFERPDIAAGTFAARTGTRAALIALEEDLFLLPDEQQQLYGHLTADPSGHGFVIVEGENTVHDAHVAEPAALLDALCRVWG